MSSYNELSLDPGIPPRHKSNQISGCKCLLITVVVLLSTGVVLVLANVANTVVRRMSDPHRALFQNASLEEVTDRGSVVQPLISRDQTFDMVATVWLRTMQGIDHVAMAEKMWAKSNSSLREGNDTLLIEEVQEVALFSDVVFRRLRLTDGKVFGTINYTLPTALFQNANLSNYDVRGSFMLIPSSPSLLNHLVNYTSWIPDRINSLPVRSWPFPLGSSQNNNKTLVDKAIETFGVSVPLVEFHSIKSRCLDVQINADREDDDDDDDEEDYQRKQVANEASVNLKKVSIKTFLSTTRGKPVLETHPYVITRTHIHVIDETRLFDRKAYFKAHKELRAKSCGRKVIGVKPSRYACVATYAVNGHWGTQLKLDVLNEDTGKAQTEWAYAPYIDATKRSLGPKDLHAVSVNRENCTTTRTESNPRFFDEEEYMNITWKVSYSGRTPFKSAALDAGYLFLPQKTNMSESDRSQALAQNYAELMSGIVGYQSEEGIQPRRRVILKTIEIILEIIIVVLNIRYWYTRTSTVSISILGIALQASAFITFDIGTAVTDWKSSDMSVIGWLSLWFFHSIELFSLPFLMIKVIARIEFGWWSNKSWIPIVQIADATHRERASERLETRTPLRSKIAIFLSIGAVYYFLTPHDHHVITATLPHSAPGDLRPTQFDELWPFIFHPIYLTGQILQLLFNRRSKTYAGGHRTAAVLTLVRNFVELAVFVPSLVGRVDARGHLAADDIVNTVVLLVMCWQAVTLPSVQQTLEDEHTE